MKAPNGVIDFYFDFVSPFGFFASLRIDSLAARYGYETRWHSMLIAVSVVKVMGMKPLLDTPLKGAYIRNDAKRYARRHGLIVPRLDFPIVDPRPVGRAFNWLQLHRPSLAKEFAQRALSTYWLENKDISDGATIEVVLSSLIEDDREALAGISSEEAASLLRQSVEDSLAKGVFGSPFFLVEREPFFGVEKMELLEAWLKEGGW